MALCLVLPHLGAAGIEILPQLLVVHLARIVGFHVLSDIFLHLISKGIPEQGFGQRCGNLVIGIAFAAA